MRSLLSATLLLLAAFAGSAQAQWTIQDFDVTYNWGAASGGDVVTVVARNPAINFNSGRAVVRFGGVESPVVEVVDAKKLRVVTPPHAEGVVTVEVKVAGTRYRSDAPFAFIRQRDPLLIPVAVETAGAFGTQWTTDISVYNSGPRPINLYPVVCSFIGGVFPCGSALIVQPQTTLRIPPRAAQYGSSYTQMYLYPPNDEREFLHVNVRARDKANPSDAGTEIPVVELSKFRSGKVVLLNVPVNDRYRTQLRVYENNYSLILTVKVFDSVTNELLLTRQTNRYALPTDSPLIGQQSFSDLLYYAEVRGHANVRIEIEEQGTLLWAMLTLTDNATQRISLITSQ
jgi:hypothetical protein